MADEDNFSDFIRRIRAGDEQAATELVRQYEPLIRREVRLRLEDARLNRIFDSTDVCQSVMASFFVRTAAGQFELERPDQVVRLLVTMARNKLASEARRQHRQRRDGRRVAAGAELDGLAADGPSPSLQVAGKELLDRLRAGLTDEERRLAELRGDGLEWAEIAAKVGGTAQARRMQLTRGIERVGRELGLEEADLE